MEYNNYLEKLFDPADSRNKMNLFSFIKSKGRDQIGTPPLQYNNRLMTSAEDRAEALSYQYESVFTEEDTTNIPDKGHSSYPAMEHNNSIWSGKTTTIHQPQEGNRTRLSTLIHPQRLC